MAKRNILTRSLKKQAETLFRENRFSDAAGVYEEVCSTDRTDADARVMLAITKVHSGEYQEAISWVLQALKIDPNHALAHHALGTAYQRQGKLQEAVVEFRQAISLRPGYANAHFFLANTLADLGDYTAAESAYLQALRLERNFSKAMAGLGRVYTRSGRLHEAVNWFHKALEIEPGCAEILAGLGNALSSQGKQNEALPLLQKAVLLEPRSYLANYSLGNLLTTLGKYDDAIGYYRTACEIQPEDEYAIGALASILERRGDFEESYSLLKPFVHAGSTNPGIVFPFAELAKHFGRHDEAVRVLEQALSEVALDQKTRTDMHFKLGKSLDAMEDYDKAFEHYHKANELSRQVNEHLVDIEAIDVQAEHIAQQIERCDHAFWAALPRATNDSERPVFVVGMPRSGTTLLEQILASHPAIHGAGELSGIETIARSLALKSTGKSDYPECLRDIPLHLLDQEAERHLRRLDDFSRNAARIVDKYPHNFLHLGLISVLFPKARVIHISRDPRDTCLSIYFQIFSPEHAYTCDLARLGKHYRTYEKLMRYWNDVLDIPILNIQYEKLLAEPGQTIRSLVDFCGLAWDDRCMKFHETKRDVNTPSYDQVRQPLYMKSVGRWIHYHNHLKELVDILQSDQS